MTKKEIKKNDSIVPSLGKLYFDIAEYINVGRSNVAQYANNQAIHTSWLIGRRIVEEEQSGAERAIYGAEILQKLSIQLISSFGKGFGLANLKNMRQFYLIYKDRISYEPRSQSLESNFKSNLSWTHYRMLMRLEDEAERKFYEYEASKENWSTPELQRQIETKLFHRVKHAATVQDRNEVIALSKKDIIAQNAQQLIRDPYILEFLGIPESHKINETKLEAALVDYLKEFLLELGKGFAFVGRQQRITIGDDHYYCDLVFYHTILKCYVIIDLKTKALTHADWGQMQLYVNYYDKEITRGDDNPTLGLILCTDKKEALVKYLMKDDNNQVFASRYQFHLPTEDELRRAIKHEYEHWLIAHIDTDNKDK